MDRRHITTGVTLVVLCGVVVLGAVWGWRSLFADIDSGDTSAEPAPTCATEQVAAGERLRSRQVRVSVFNGGGRSGLAERTLARLERRGFLPGDLGNAPEDVRVRRVQVWSTEEGDPTARLVARQFGKKVRVRVTEEDLGRGIDVVVGDKFKGLVKAPRSIRLRQSDDVCIPVETAGSEPAAEAVAAAAVRG